MKYAKISVMTPGASDGATFPISLHDVRQAAAALDQIVFRTPLLENADVNDLLGGRLLIKVESSQLTGSFKIRGAYWRMLNMTAEELGRGAITYSSGNHALGVARAATALGSSALIVMPDDVDQAKRDAVLALGAEVVTYVRDQENYDEVVERLRNETGRTHVPPSAHPLVLAGSGTVATELFEQADLLGTCPEVILIPCGGGGLAASTAIVASEVSPSAQVFAVEPEHFDDTKRSLEAGEPVPNPVGGRTICDAIMTPVPNSVTFPINAKLLAGGLVVTDDEVRQAMRFAFEHFKIVVEPGGAVGIAAALQQRAELRGKTVATVVTGANIDPDRFFSVLGSSAHQ